MALYDNIGIRYYKYTQPYIYSIQFLPCEINIRPNTEQIGTKNPLGKAKWAQ